VVEKTHNTVTNGLYNLIFLYFNIFIFFFYFYLQIQFGYLMLHFLRPIIFDDCDYPKIVLFIGFIQAIALFTLFFDFYRRAYLTKNKKKINK